MMYDGDERVGIHVDPRRKAVGIDPAWYRKEPAMRKIKPWQIVIGVFASLLILCIGGMAFVGYNMSSDPAPTQPVVTSTNLGLNPATAPPAAPASVTVTGKGNSVVQAGAVLNGAFNVEYQFGSWCGIAHFLTAKGEEGAALLEDINDCADDVNAKLSGSTILHLKNVTQLKVENTKGPWTIKLTPIG